MKLVVAGRYPLETTRIRDGVEAYISYLSKGLQQLKIPDLEIHVVTCREDVEKDNIITTDNFTVWFLPSISLKRFGNITLQMGDRYKIKKKIKAINPDIVHAHGTSSYASAALETGYPTLLTVMGIMFKEAEVGKKGVLNWFRGFSRSQLERICLKRATDIICITPYVREAIIGLTNAKFEIVEPPINDSYFKLENREVPNRILFVGNLERRKNLLGLLKTINIIKEQIPQVELHIVGIIKEKDYFVTLKQYVKANKLEDNVTFREHIMEDQLTKEFSECCMLALPSREESAGMVIQQAMASGKAVVATRVGGIPYFVEDGQTGFLVECDDVNALAKKIAQLLKNDDLRVKMGSLGKQTAIKRFKAEIVAQKIYKAYQGILENREPSS